METALDVVELFESNLIELGTVPDCVELLRKVCLLGVKLSSQLKNVGIGELNGYTPSPLSVALGNCVSPIINGNNDFRIFKYMSFPGKIEKLLGEHNYLKEHFGSINDYMGELENKLSIEWCQGFSTRCEVKKLHPSIPNAAIKTVGDLLKQLYQIKIKETLVLDFKIKRRENNYLKFDMGTGWLIAKEEEFLSPTAFIDVPKNIISSKLTVGMFILLLERFPENRFIKEINLNGKDGPIKINLHQQGIYIFD